MKRGYSGDVPAMIVATALFIAAFMTIVIILIHSATVTQ